MYRSELDHPNSQHNTATGASSSLQVHFPQSANDPANQSAHVSLNGYYDREALTLKKGFKAPTGPAPPDTRMDTAAGRFGSNAERANKLYSANTQLLNEIERTQRARQLQRQQREQETIQQ